MPAGGQSPHRTVGGSGARHVDARCDEGQAGGRGTDGRGGLLGQDHRSHQQDKPPEEPSQRIRIDQANSGRWSTTRPVLSFRHLIEG
jgi:hypothetical protein